MNDIIRFYNNDHQVTNAIGDSPRGECYDWCRIEKDGTLTFGTEEGNYAGGETLSRRFVVADGGKEYRNDVPIAIYLNAVRSEILSLYKHDILLYTNIIRMLANKSEWNDLINVWLYEETLMEQAQHQRDLFGYKDIEDHYKQLIQVCKRNVREHQNKLIMTFDKTKGA